MTAKHPMIPFPVIVRAADGDIEAVNRLYAITAVLLPAVPCVPAERRIRNTHMVVDETLRRRMKHV